MSAMEWLMYANIAVWIGLGLYVTFIAQAQKTLQRRLQQMELLRHDK